jgi:hypothetical protein
VVRGELSAGEEEGSRGRAGPEACGNMREPGACGGCRVWRRFYMRVGRPQPLDVDVDN